VILQSTAINQKYSHHETTCDKRNKYTTIISEIWRLVAELFFKEMDHRHIKQRKKDDSCAVYIVQVSWHRI